jgi:hypothetical protein
MSVINSNPFGGAFPPGAGFPNFENGGPTAAPQAFLQAPDDVAATPWNAPPGFPNAAASAAGPDASWSFGSVMNDFMNAVSSLLGQLGSALGTGPSAPGTTGSTPGLPSVPSPAPAPSPGGETYYSNATASSVGDPHDAFDGTAGNGTQTGDHWNNMDAHGNLLSSDSFAGGYRISTSVTQPNASGVTLNESATVTTNGGATSVTLNGDGSYSVISNGQSVSLQQGVATSLGNGESVTLNADGSLTVNDSNGQGGSIATTLSLNHSSGVDVRASATDVDLGGYLTRLGAGPNPGPSPANPGTPPGPPPAPAAPNVGAAVPPWPSALNAAANPLGASTPFSSAADPLDPFGLGAI